MANTQPEILKKILSKESLFWENPRKAAIGRVFRGTEKSLEKVQKKFGIGFPDILDAEKRLERFRPFFKIAFPETDEGIIESPLKSAANFSREVLDIERGFYIKCDNLLPVAGSVKARGGVYEILKYAENLAVENNLIAKGLDYSAFASSSMNAFFSKYHVAVGSTGNLGMSIGIISAKLGFKVTIYMSNDAKEWKKNNLRNIGVNVIEHAGSYVEAVEDGRKSCKRDPHSYFVDDENSKELFLGYSVAALRLKKQLDEMGIRVNTDNSLYVYLPCGVGGAPGGISFGLKHVFGNNVKCYFAEPVNAPSVLLGFLAGKKINFKDYDFIMETDADGLAVDSPSELVLDICRDLIDGIYTIDDITMYRDLYQLKNFENEKIEVSASASLHGPVITGNAGKKGTHIAWLTGGVFVPEKEYSVMYERGSDKRYPSGHPAA